MIANPEKGVDWICSLWEGIRSSPDSICEPVWLASPFSPCRKTLCAHSSGPPFCLFSPYRAAVLLVSASNPWGLCVEIALIMGGFVVLGVIV